MRWKLSLMRCADNEMLVGDVDSVSNTDPCENSAVLFPLFHAVPSRPHRFEVKMTDGWNRFLLPGAASWFPNYLSRPRGINNQIITGRTSPSCCWAESKCLARGRVHGTWVQLESAFRCPSAVVSTRTLDGMSFIAHERTEENRNFPFFFLSFARWVHQPFNPRLLLFLLCQ